jgi:hypothetical protein
MSFISLKTDGAIRIQCGATRTLMFAGRSRRLMSASRCWAKVTMGEVLPDGAQGSGGAESAQELTTFHAVTALSFRLPAHG